RASRFECSGCDDSIVDSGPPLPYRVHALSLRSGDQRRSASVHLRRWRGKSFNFSGYASRSHGHTEGLPEERRYRSPRASRYVQVLWLRTGLSNVPLCVKLLDEADELRKLRALANRRTADLIPALFHEMFGDSVENPGGYEIQQLGAVCNRIIDGTHQPPAFAQKGIPFLFVRNIVSGSIDFNTEKFVTEDTET